ncbi:G patch domain-containing protein 4 isoform X2 [Echeneis naucrates]|uniref:G patch domain-containing protein 4 n=2 Tax=Echeneis naucrates TaxID=173247 RepID=A0A665UBG3_ECHNA|nr:G patch domain-containing protein 4 isoform X2 [Echeneis naucrates]XP_029360711.1 G patch domain-containing protein 4 isoform X2 [Echeneis naucrates]
MAEAVEEKSRGLKFAEQQLLRHGWEHGKGLGRAENGISEAIKVKVKCDKGGVGHKEGEQFTFHWWDHVFNKASSSLQVESDQNGIKLKKTEEDEEDAMISNKKPRKATLAKAKLYGCFVKSATLLSGQEQPEPKCSNSDDSSSSEEEDDQRLDLSSTTKLSDADLIKACGGRTAHKGARHGLTMSAKLARLEQQEAEFMAKYGKKHQPASPSLVCVTLAPSAKSAELPVEKEAAAAAAEDFQSRKMKKKSSNYLNGNEASERAKTDINPNKKKKKRKRANDEVEEATAAVPVEHVMFSENSEVDQPPITKRKHKKKKKRDEVDVAPSSPAASNNLEQKAELHTDTRDIKKKKKKRSLSKHHSEEEKRNKTESSQSEQRDAVSKKEVEVMEEQSKAKQKRKKCKKDDLILDNHINREVIIPKKKKKKSKDSV